MYYEETYPCVCIHAMETAVTMLLGLGPCLEKYILESVSTTSMHIHYIYHNLNVCLIRERIFSVSPFNNIEL